MSSEGQPIDPRIPFYIPENWIQPTAGGGGSFINFPTTQTANINFPGSILCSNLQSFAPTALMNLFNNSTSGNIQIANANTFTGGIVINANATVPVANQTIIGTSARALVAPLLHTSEIYGTGVFAGQVNVNADLLVANGFELYTNAIEPNGTGLNIGTTTGGIINLGTNASRADAINIGTGMTIAGDINLGGALGTTNALKLESGFISCEGNLPLNIGTFVGRTRPIDIGTGMTGGFINLGGATTTVRTDNLGGLTTNLTLTTNTIITPLSGLYTNIIEPNGSGLTIGATSGIINLGTGASRANDINIGTAMTSAATVNIGIAASKINIYSKLQSGLRLDYIPTTYSGIDTYMGGYREGTYEPATPFTQTLNTIEQRIVGSIPALLFGLYQVNVNASLSTSLLNPYLTFGIYTKVGAPAWVNGNLRGIDGTVVVSLSRVNTYPTTNVTDVFTLSMTGLLVMSPTAYVGIVVGNADTAVSQNITFIDTYMSVLRVG